MAQAIAQPPETGCTDHPRPVKGPLGRTRGDTAAPSQASPGGRAEGAQAPQRAVTLQTLVEALQRIEPPAGVIGANLAPDLAAYAAKPEWIWRESGRPEIGQPLRGYGCTITMFPRLAAARSSHFDPPTPSHLGCIWMKMLPVFCEFSSVLIWQNPCCAMGRVGQKRGTVRLGPALRRRRITCSI
jgi:hypothetical protein